MFSVPYVVKSVFFIRGISARPSDWVPDVPQDEVPSDSSLDCGRFFMFIPDHCIQSLQESNGFSAMQVAE